jgi:hypothetical protein
VLLCCIVLFCVLLCCLVLCSVVLFCFVFCCVALFCFVGYVAVLCSVAIFCLVFCCVFSFCFVFCFVVVFFCSVVLLSVVGFPYYKINETYLRRTNLFKTNQQFSILINVLIRNNVIGHMAKKRISFRGTKRLISAGPDGILVQFSLVHPYKSYYVVSILIILLYTLRSLKRFLPFQCFH